jgi:outer membrane scaffolding protein for murein synthesis (MipA/OmpV family)
MARLAAAWALAACLCGPSLAADTAPLRDAWDVTIGAGVGYDPDYEGAKSHSFEPVPYFDITWYDADGRDRTFLNVDDGLGIYVISTPSFRLGPLVTWREGRRERWSSDLRGLGDASSSFQAGAIVEYQPHDCCYLFLKGRHDINADYGTFVDIGGEVTAPLAPQHWFINVRATATWASRSGTQPMFGITPAQSLASGLAPYSPSSGMHDAQVTPSLIYDFDGHWSIAGRVKYERLLDQAADSPLIKSRGSADQFSTELILNYHF